MTLDSFLLALFDDGNVSVGEVAPISVEERNQAAAVLAARERIIRAWFPGAAPELLMPAAVWGAEVFYRTCQAVVFRDLEVAEVEKMLAVPCPAGDLAATHYSVDLAMCFLPDFAHFAKSVSQDDPVCQQLQRLGAAWPLSSVGMTLAESPSIDALIPHANLFQYYVDRVLSKNDPARRNEPRVEQAIAAVYGAYESGFSK